jgi:type II secretory pathway component PulL
MGFDLLSRLYLEIGQSSLKMLDGDDGLELSLDRQENGRLTPACRERLVSSLRVFLKKQGWRARRRAYCAIGARGVSLRRVTLPACSKEELQRLLLLQIEREFPLSPDELAWGYQQLGQKHPTSNGNPAGQELLVVAVKKEVLQEYADILAACGVTPIFTLAALARSSLCPQAPSSFAVLEVGRKQSELISFEKGVPSAIRILPWGGENITRALEKSLELNHLQAEELKLQWDRGHLSNVEPREKIQAAVDSELTSLAGAIQPSWLGQKLYVSGKSSRLAELAPRLASAIRGKTECERINVSGGEGCSAAILGLKRSCEETANGEPLILHLNSSRENESSARPMQWKLAVLAALLLFGLFSIRYVEAFVQKPRLARSIVQIKSYREKLPKIDRELSFLQYLKTNQPPYLNPIFVLANSAPPGSRIESLSMNRRGDLSFRAGMQNSQQVVDFRSKLIESGLFATLSVEEQTPTPDRQKIVVRMVGQWKPLSELPATANSTQSATGRDGPSRSRRPSSQPVVDVPGGTQPPASQPTRVSAGSPVRSASPPQPTE